MHKDFTHKTLEELAHSNFRYASILDSFGISFYHKPHSTLQNICSTRYINLEKVIQKLLQAEQLHPPIDIERFKSASTESVIAYLQHSHRNFIRTKLPYMAKLIADIRPACFDEPEIAQDLKIIFPLFAEDFIHHIHEEEDTTFAYVQELINADSSRYFNLPKLYFKMRGISLSAIYEEHVEEDDEMSGIRQLTSDYAIHATTGVYTTVVYSELKSFERILCEHASIENEILFPRAIALERKIKLKMTAKAKMN